jgi:hypothetical protein
MMLPSRRAQSAVEYAIFIAAVLLGLVGLQIYFQRAVGGNLKSKSDSIGDQFSLKQSSFSETTSVQGRHSETDGLNVSYSTYSRGLEKNAFSANDLTNWRGQVGGAVTTATAYQGGTYTGTRSQQTLSAYNASLSQEAGLQ